MHMPPWPMQTATLLATKATQLPSTTMAEPGSSRGLPPRFAVPMTVERGAGGGALPAQVGSGTTGGGAWAERRLFVGFVSSRIAALWTTTGGALPCPQAVPHSRGAGMAGGAAASDVPVISRWSVVQETMARVAERCELCGETMLRGAFLFAQARRRLATLAAASANNNHQLNPHARPQVSGTRGSTPQPQLHCSSPAQPSPHRALFPPSLANSTQPPISQASSQDRHAGPPFATSARTPSAQTRTHTLTPSPASLQPCTPSFSPATSIAATGSLLEGKVSTGEGKGASRHSNAPKRPTWRAGGRHRGNTDSGVKGVGGIFGTNGVWRGPVVVEGGRLEAGYAARLLTAALACACKYTEDTRWNNAAFATFSGIPLRDLNRLERALLTLTDWRLHAGEIELERFWRWLVATQQQSMAMPIISIQSPRHLHTPHQTVIMSRVVTSQTLSGPKVVMTSQPLSDSQPLSGPRVVVTSHPLSASQPLSGPRVVTSQALSVPVPIGGQTGVRMGATITTAKGEDVARDEALWAQLLSLPLYVILGLVGPERSRADTVLTDRASRALSLHQPHNPHNPQPTVAVQTHSTDGVTAGIMTGLPRTETDHRPN
jgi:hypothetical protein